MQIYLPIYDIVIDIHDAVLEISGGKAGILDANVIRAAVDRPKTYLSYHENSDIHTVCAVLLDSLARNHAFVEGNKRTALMVAILTYELNDIVLNFTPQMNKEFEDLVLWVVIDKPGIVEIAKNLQTLVERFQSADIRVFVQKLRSLLKPFRN